MKKNVLIVGSEGFIGKKLVEVFGAENVISCDICVGVEQRNNYIKCDVTEKDSVGKVAGYLKKNNLMLDILVYTVGVYEKGKVTEISPDQWKRSMDINVNGLYNVLHELIPYINNKGKIIAIASQFGLVGTYESAAYCTAKAAMINLIRSVALDFGQKKIFANCVCPGFFESEFLHNVERNISMKKEWMSVTAMLPKSKVSIDDVVKVIRMLSDNDSITGQCITVDGGYTAR